MKLYLISFIVDRTPYMGDRKKGYRDQRIVWANTADEAQDKLEAAVAPRSEHGDDGYHLHSIEIHEAIA